MAQTAEGPRLQAPATPSHQLGAARGPRRTPASRTKKPYARPALAAASAAPSDYQSQASPGFLRGMRSLVSRLWGTSLRPSGRSAATECVSANAPSECAAPDLEIHSRAQPAAEPVERHFPPATISAASAASVSAAFGDATPATAYHAATVAERPRSRRPTAESLFAPSPFAYNRRLATATPSVASLRDAQRASTISPALSRRHSSLRGDNATSGPSFSTQAMAPPEGRAASGDAALSLRYVSPSNARRLLSTLGSINTPILEARSRSAGGPLQAHRPAATPATEKPTPLPLRRLPVSLLALSDAPSKAHRPPLAGADDPAGTETLRRSTSLRSIPQRRGAAPSLARTIQLQQARKAVAERLVRGRTAEQHAANVDTDTSGHSHAPRAEVRGAAASAPEAGRTRMRESEDDPKHSKRRRADDGRAIDVLGDMDASGSELHGPRREADRLGRTRRRPAVRGKRAASAADAAVKWRFSARLDPLSDDEDGSSSDSDEDREALTSKVPSSRIRGGELIGLSLRPTASAASTGNGAIAATVRPTGFGSTRTPTPIVSEAAPGASAPAVLGQRAATAAASLPTASAPATEVAPTPAQGPTPGMSVSASSAGPTAKPLQVAVSSEGAERHADTRSEKPAEKQTDTPAAAPAAVPAAASIFGNTVPVAAEEDTDKPKSAALSTPAFSFGGFSAPKRSADESDTSAKDAAAKSTPFNFGSASTATSAAGTAVHEKPAAQPAPAFSFGLSKPAQAGESTTGLSFGVSKPAVSFGESKPAVSFGASVAGPMATTSAEAKAAPVFKFGMGLSTSSTESGGDKKDTPTGSANGAPTTSANMFALPSSSAAPAPSLAATGGFASSKRGRDDDAASSATEKPKFSFGANGSTFGGGAFSTTKAPVFGAEATKASPSGADMAMDGDAESKAPEAAAAPKGFGGFSFTKPAGASSGTLGTGPSFGSSTSFAKPSRILDLTQGASGMGATSGSSAPETMATSDGMDSSPAPAGFATFGTKPSFGGFGSGGASPSPASKPAPLMSFGGLGGAASTGSAAKKPAFSFGSLNTPGAASFAATTVPTPAVPSFGSSVAAAPTPSFGAPAATPSSFNFGAASSPAATPSTPAFSFGGKPPLPQTTSGFGNPSAQSVSGFGSRPAQTSSAFGSQSTQSVGGFGSSLAPPASKPSNLGFGAASSTGPGFGAASSTGPAPFNFSSNTSTGFGSAATGGGFGQQSETAPPSAFGSRPGGFGSASSASAFGAASGASGFGAASTASGFGAASTASGFGAASSASTGGPQFMFGQGQPAGQPAGAPSTSFQFGSNAGGFGAGSAAEPASAASFSFGSSTAQSASQGGPFQFSASVAQPSNAATGGITLGRVPSGSNASTSSQYRQIARPRSRRLH